MRVPVDKPLAVFINELIRVGKLYLFYQTDDWKELRAAILKENHNECRECASKGKVVEANCVHHVNHVTVRPDLALSKYYYDELGYKRENLIPLCNACHNKVHPEKLKKRNKVEGFTNVERW